MDNGKDLTEKDSANEIIRQNRIAQVHDWLCQLVIAQEQIALRSKSYDEAIATLQVEKKEAIGAELIGLECELIKSIKAVGIFVNQTVKGTWFTDDGVGNQAVWSKGRTSWDNEKLVSYIPEIKEEELRKKFEACKKIGNPSVSIRMSKREDEEPTLESLF